MFVWLRSRTGFLCHLHSVYPFLGPYLQGFYRTLYPPKERSSGRQRQSDDVAQAEEDEEFSQRIDYNAKERAHLSWVEEDELDQSTVQSDSRSDQTNDPPSFVYPAQRMRNDVLALEEFFKSEEPPIVSIRSTKVTVILYMFGDASGLGKGNSVKPKNVPGKLNTQANNLRFRIGIWKPEESEESSNWREFTNVIESLEDEGEQGNLKGAEVFFCTDNSTTEAAIAKGTSSSDKLNALVIRFHLIEVKYQCKMWVCHVSGKRMQAQGTDGISRGCLEDGVMTGLLMESFLPFHDSALQRSESLSNWLVSWCGDEEAEFLSPEQWFTRGHDHLGGNIGSDGFLEAIHPIWHLRVVSSPSCRRCRTGGVAEGEDQENQVESRFRLSSTDDSSLDTPTLQSC